MFRKQVVAVVLVGLMAGCGYRVASKNRLAPGIEAVTVLPLRNETTTFEVEQILTRSLVRAFVEKTGYRVTDQVSQADAILEGTIASVTANPVTFGQTSFGSTFLVVLRARVELRDRQGNTLFKNDDYLFREQYVINSDVENFFSELNPALDRIAADFASSVVTTILEQF